jgi:hypothetical protein
LAAARIDIDGIMYPEQPLKISGNGKIGRHSSHQTARVGR